MIYDGFTGIPSNTTDSDSPATSVEPATASTVFDGNNAEPTTATSLANTVTTTSGKPFMNSTNSAAVTSADLGTTNAEEHPGSALAFDSLQAYTITRMSTSGSNNDESYFTCSGEKIKHLSLESYEKCANSCISLSECKCFGLESGNCLLYR